MDLMREACVLCCVVLVKTQIWREAEDDQFMFSFVKVWRMEVAASQVEAITHGLWYLIVSSGVKTLSSDLHWLYFAITYNVILLKALQRNFSYLLSIVKTLFWSSLSRSGYDDACAYSKKSLVLSHLKCFGPSLCGVCLGQCVMRRLRFRDTRTKTRNGTYEEDTVEHDRRWDLPIFTHCCRATSIQHAGDPIYLTQQQNG